MNESPFNTSQAYAAHLDNNDPLSTYREQFVIDDDDLLYMDGNSLGRLPKASISVLEKVIRQDWGRRLIRSWGEGWYDAPIQLGNKIGQLIGADEGQVIVGDSTTVNFYKAICAALDSNSERKKIISDVHNFPTDVYTIDGIIKTLSRSYTLQLVGTQDGITPDLDELDASLDEHTALLVLSTPTFKSGYLYDMAAITKKAHRCGALVLWDLCHSAGVIPLELDDWGVDLAVGCTYKYLNGGPGSPAFLYIRRDLQNKMRSPIQGWWGHKSPFDFDLDYAPADGIRRFLAGTPPILSTLAVEPAVDMILAAGIESIRQKSIGLSTYLIQLCDAVLQPLGFELGSPREPEFRGSHVSLKHADAYRISQSMIKDMQIIPDFREPDNIRLGLAPLYTSYQEVWCTIMRMQKIMEEGFYKKHTQQRSTVR